jgi:hypothetical protein
MIQAPCWIRGANLARPIGSDAVASIRQIRGTEAGAAPFRQNRRTTHLSVLTRLRPQSVSRQDR